MASLTFHSVRVAGYRLEASISSEGPLISVIKHPFQQANLGVSFLRYVDQELAAWAGVEEGWWIAKYGRDFLVDLSGIESQDSEEISQEFGLPIWSPVSTSFDPMNAFYQGKAWNGLISWVHSHPRLAAKLSRGHAYYLPQWYDDARGASVPPSRPLRCA